MIAKWQNEEEQEPQHFEKHEKPLEHAQSETTLRKTD